MSRMRVDLRTRSGFTLGEAIAVLAILFVCTLFAVMALPRMRENARMAGCQRNLGQIGLGLLQYAQAQEFLPPLTKIDGIDPAPDPSTSAGPLRLMLESLQLPDFNELMNRSTPAKQQPQAVPGERPVRGFVCGSDPWAISGIHRAPISYRGTTGGPYSSAGPVGTDGVFAVGRLRTLAQIEAGDGAAFTAAFSERLVGTGKPGERDPANYLVGPSPIPLEGCVPPADGVGMRGDAGSSWYHADYRSTLYNHAHPPNWGSSCIAADGQTADMGASSGHPNGVNLLLMDGSVRTIRATVDYKVWVGFGSIGSPRPNPEVPPSSKRESAP